MKSVELKTCGFSVNRVKTFCVDGVTRLVIEMHCSTQVQKT